MTFTLLSELQAFVEWVNSDTQEWLLSDEDVEEYIKGVRDSFKRKYLSKEAKGNQLRLSALGKPAVLNALTKLGHVESSKVTNKLKHIFHTGDMFESFIFAAAKAYGYNLICDQQEVEFEGVLGHIDGVLDAPLGQVLVEVKTMSQNYFGQFTKKQNDDRGYVTQLATYQHCMSLDAYWLCLNKSTHEVVLVQPDAIQLADALNRAKRVVERMRQVNTLSDVLKVFKAPPAVEEVYRRSGTGRYILPESMRWSEYASCFYELMTDTNGYGKPTQYVVGYRTPEEMVALVEQCSKAA